MSRGVTVDRLLTVGEVAELLGTTERFPRRLIAERRIEFVKIGRYVRIRETTLVAFIEAGRVEALTVADIWPRRKGAA
jgi:excisionase family DNA binding protein